MEAERLFTQALGIQAPWKIESIKFDPVEKRLDVCVDFAKGSVFPYENPQTGKTEFCKAYDTVEKTWRHLNFFEHICHIHARVPRIQPVCGGTRMVLPPWSGKVHGFTLLFEALILQMCMDMPISKAGKILNTTDHKLWAVLEGYVNQALSVADYGDIFAVGMDETSMRKGHIYMTLFVDLKGKRTIFVTQGKDHSTVDAFVKDLKEHEGDPQNIKDISCDMSPAFIKGVKNSLPNAQITFDKFHVIKIINEGINAVRKDEIKSTPILKGNKFIFLKNDCSLTVKQRKIKTRLSKFNLKTMRALQIREAFQNIYTAQTMEEFILLLKRWYFWATHSRLAPMIKAAKTIKRHWNGILRWKISQINNGILEGLNSVIQAAKRKARGYQFKHFRVMVYLLTGKLDLSKLNIHVPTRF